MAADTDNDHRDDSPSDEESTQEQLTRNWNELLQELRVTQTGVQILTAFLLTVPFSNGFPKLDSFQRTTYLVVLCGSIVSTGFVVAPVAFHRILFRQRQRAWLVEAANQSARAGLVVLALTTSGALLLVFDVVSTRTAGLWALAVAMVFFVVFWGLLPAWGNRDGRGGGDEDEPGDGESGAR